MCYICSCFSWSLDLLQRIITFGLGCIVCIAIFLGLTISIVAGIAYGYNYSMAEFITFTRSDVTVFMRRGQFYDKPEVSKRHYRRAGEEEEIFSTNNTTDYEDHRHIDESKPLADTWLKTQDTRKYAEILTKYNPNNKPDSPEDLAQTLGPPAPEAEPIRIADIKPVQGVIHYRPTTETPVISIVSDAQVTTVSWRSTPEVMMRNFKPIQSDPIFDKHADIVYVSSPDTDPVSVIGPKEKAKEASARKLHDAFHESYVPMRVWDTTTGGLVSDEPEEIDEDNIVYKPV